MWREIERAVEVRVVESSSFAVTYRDPTLGDLWATTADFLRAFEPVQAQRSEGEKP